MSDPLKPKFPRAEAIAAAKGVLHLFDSPKLIIAGSLRRRKPLVGDVEIVYIPHIKTAPDTEDFFASKTVNLSDHSITVMCQTGILRPRENVLGRTTWGEANKLAIHIPSGIPIDFFATSEAAWWNYLVCRTGGAQNNVAISNAALKKGWLWHPYKFGFTDARGQWHRVTSEREVFELAGLPYLEPWERS